MEALERQLAADSAGTPAQQAVRRGELARDLLGAACLRGSFVYASGVHSNVYFDKYLFVTRPTILRRLASLLAEGIPANVDRLAGAGLGATALVAALSLETGLPFVIVRDASRAGDVKIEGELHAGERVAMIEDVISTGTQAIRAAEAVTARGAHVSAVISAIDREEGGEQNIAAAGMQLRALFRRSELGF